MQVTIPYREAPHPFSKNLLSTCFVKDIALALVGRGTEGRYSAKGLDTIPTLNLLITGAGDNDMNTYVKRSVTMRLHLVL